MDDKVWNSDFVQFPRLLAEIRAMGLIRREMDHLRESMDLKGLELEELLIRAEIKWEKIKAGYKKERKGGRVAKEVQHP